MGIGSGNQQRLEERTMSQARKTLSAAEQQRIVEDLMEALDGAPVLAAIDILELTKKQVLYLATVSKPEDDLARRQMQFQQIPHSSTPAAKMRSRRRAA